MPTMSTEPTMFMPPPARGSARLLASSVHASCGSVRWFRFVDHRQVRGLGKPPRVAAGQNAGHRKADEEPNVVH